MKQIVTLDWPDDLAAALDAAGYSPERLSEEALAHLAAALFKQRILTLGQATALAGMSQWDFIPFLGGQGIPVADYDDAQVRNELEAGRWLSIHPSE